MCNGYKAALCLILDFIFASPNAYRQTIGAHMPKARPDYMQVTCEKTLPMINRSYLIQYLFLEFPLNLLSRLICVGFAVEVKKGAEVELGCLQELDLSDVDIL